MNSKLSMVDVRMHGFARRSTVDQALCWLEDQLAPLPDEFVGLDRAGGRILAQNVQSQIDVPGFERAMMDGFAVRAGDTQGASTYNRLALRIVGESLPALQFESQVKPGDAVRIATGAPLPVGADAVLPVEQTELEGGQLAVQAEVCPGKNVGRRGEDIACGSVVLERGRLLRPQDLGVLSSIGLPQVPVIRQPRVRVVVTGNELLPAGSVPKGHQICDANSPMLAGLIDRDGGIVINPGIVPDEADQIATALRTECDVVLVSGGSSVGPDDYAPMQLAAQGELAIHGIAMRPSSPAGMGRLEHRLVFLLPGNPVSCLCAYDFFAGRAIRALGGRHRDWPYRKTSLPLQRKLVSAVGRVDYARVRLVNQGVEPLAIGGASILSSTTRADGFVIVPGDSEGFAPGMEVEVFLYA